MKTGILLINLGTPDSPEIKNVRNYLAEFLGDPYVLDIHPIARWLLLNLLILPTRPKKSASAYRSIWTEQGSPLLTNSQALMDNTQGLLGKNYFVTLGMRYGKPSITMAIEQLKDCQQLIILPLFPQYSLAATETAIVTAKVLAAKIWHADKIHVIKDFYTQPSFIATQALFIQDSLGERKVDQLLFSYHGLPERQIKKICAAGDRCDMQQACPNISRDNQNCYRAQCFATSDALAKILQLKESQYLTTFQSRLGRTPWIRPYTDKALISLAAHGAKNIAIVCPSFVADCLDTLEEIGIRARKQWRDLGGENLYLIPCVNAEAGWVADIIHLHESNDVKI